MFLMSGAVVGGSFFMWFLFNGESVCFLDFFNKMIVLAVVCLGGGLG